MRRIVFLLFFLILCVSCNNDPKAELNQSSNYDWTRVVNWQGELTSFPQNPEEGYAFYNTSDGYSYIYIAKQGWTPLAKSGFGINWLGEKTDFPTSAKYGDAFYNSLQGSSYIYDGSKWQLLARSGANGSGQSTSKLQISIDDVVLDYKKTSWKIEYNPDIDLETRTVTVKNIGSETVFFSDEGAIVNNSYLGLTDYPYYDLSADADISNVPSSLEPGSSFSMTVSYNPSKYVSLYISFYNSTLHNPISISFVQNSSDTNTTYVHNSNPSLSLSLGMYSPSFHHSLSSKSITLKEGTQTAIEQLDFNVCEANTYGQCARITISTSGINDSLFLIGDPFIWIEGENAEDFVIDALPQKNLKLTKGESYTASIVFSPKSIGEKTATLHISTGFAGHEDIQIPLLGSCETIEDYYAVYGYAPIGMNGNIVEDGQGGCFLITGSSSKKILIYRINSFGKCNLVKTMDYPRYSSIKYVEYANGKLCLYLADGETRTYYRYDPAKIMIDISDYSYKTASYDSSYLSELKSTIIAGTTYDYKGSYCGYVLGIKGSYSYDSELDVFNNKEELLASVINVSPGSEYISKYCVSGDYLYFFNMPYCLRRIRLDELMEELKEKFEI